MVRAALDALSIGPAQKSCRLLDPACGEGAFLLAAFDALCERRGADSESRRTINGEQRLTPASRLVVMRDFLFGVDIDPVAVEALRRSLIERIAATGPLARTARAVVETNVRVGDALTGPGFEQSALPASLTENHAHFDWRREFPTVARAGGFDLVIGNPPYLRERDARELFARIAATELGARWREARMDLWYYFVHRGLDLLRPGGVLSFVVSSYWTASRGARRLIARLERETRFEEVELLGDEPLFAGVAGRHMVFRLRKRTGSDVAAGQRDDPCRIRIRSGEPDALVDDRAAEIPRRSGVAEHYLSHAELFQHERLVLTPSDPDDRCEKGVRPLGELFDTRQGMAENPPTISRRIEREFDGRYVAGEGVFVLSAVEVARLRLTRDEASLLRPYFDTVAVKRYGLTALPTNRVLYLTRETAPTLDRFPNVARHLERFRPLLERRRETRLGRSAWWHLHWPRDETIFLRPRILSVQMGRRPQFVFVDRPAYVGFSVNVILEKPAGSPPLAALAGLLNSTRASRWFARHAKRRGVHLEINGHILRRFPVPDRNGGLERSIAGLVERRQEQATEAAFANDLEREIDRLVERWFGDAACEPAERSTFPVGSISSIRG
jgi:hypothetical protein